MSLYGTALNGVADYTGYATKRTEAVTKLSQQLNTTGVGAEDYQSLQAQLSSLSNDLEFANGILSVIVNNIKNLQV